MGWFDTDPPVPPDPNAPPDPGFLTTHLANPWVSIPTAVGLGLLAGTGNGGSRMAQVGNGVLQLGMGAERGNYERQKQLRLSDAMNKLAGATTPTSVNKIGVDPDTATFDLPDTDQPANANPLAPPEPLPQYTATEQKPMFTDRQREYLKAIGQEDPRAALQAMNASIFKQPTTPHWVQRDDGSVVAVDQTTLAPTTVLPGIKPTTYEDAVKQIPKNLQPGTKVDVNFGKGGKVTQEAPKEKDPKDEPPITEVQAIAILGKVNRGVPLNQRELKMLGTEKPEEAKQIVQEMQRIKQAGQVDTRTAIGQAMAAIHAASRADAERQKREQFTGEEGSLFRVNEKTGEIEDAVNAGMPAAEAKKNGFRKLAAAEKTTLQRGQAALDSLDDFEASARRVLGKEPGVANMSFQQLENWFKGKQSDPDVVLFQTQMTRSLPLMIQAMGMSGARAGAKILEIERAALPNSGMTVGTAIQLLDRDRKTIRDVQAQTVSGKFTGQKKPDEAPKPSDGAPKQKETPQQVHDRLLGIKPK